MTDSSPDHITTLLFDLGGVLIELGSLDSMLATSHLPVDTVWENWISNPAVRRFESGQCDENEFAETMISDLSLDTSPDEFLELFMAWPRGLYPGARHLLDQLSARYRLACLSNSNKTHVQGVPDMREVLSCFDARFLSHQTGILKPDAAAFLHVLETLGLSSGEVLFFDDNPGNVAAAINLGMQAELVEAPEGVQNALKRHGIAL